MSQKLLAFVREAVRLDRFKSRDVTGDGAPETFCNYFVDHVAHEVGCDDFRPVKGGYPMLANAMVMYMGANTDRWQELDPDEAQVEANFGHLVIAGWNNDNGHGHVNIIIPGALTWSKQFGDDVPNCANVGPSNFFGRPVSYGFGKDMKPRYWKWIKPKEETV